MKTTSISAKPGQRGSALMLTMIMTGIALATLAGAMSWSANSTRLTHRSIQYTRSLAAAEAATEKVLGRINHDFLSNGEKLVWDNAKSYRKTLPDPSDSSYWSNWEFTDPAPNTDEDDDDDDQGSKSKVNRIHVEGPNASTSVILNAPYAGLRAFASSWTVVSHARDKASILKVVGGVSQQTQLNRIPIYQFALYSSGDMEISCGEDFTVTGRVHANRTLYVEPDDLLRFLSGVTAVNGIVFQRDPLDTRGDPKGAVVYQGTKTTPVPAMTLPIGASNTPVAIREIIQPPPSSENRNSQLGRMRFYNQTDMILTVSDTGVAATSGSFDNFKTIIPTKELATFVTVTNSFEDAREEKTVKPIDVNIGRLKAWSATNTSLRGLLGSRNVSSVYVLDRRTLPGTSLAAVRLVNGADLPADGLTVATARPLYVLGDYNQANPANLGTTNTSTTRPASLVADAVTILSGNWEDANSTLGGGARKAAPTSVNAAILAGVVETTAGQYSGGMENFPRFLEEWGDANIFTYNGSMVKMFPSLYATNSWGQENVYAPPKRNWAYDLNFDDPTKLPPLTPSLQTVIRSQWATVAPDRNVAAAVP